MVHFQLRLFGRLRGLSEEKLDAEVATLNTVSLAQP